MKLPIYAVVWILLLEYVLSLHILPEQNTETNDKADEKQAAEEKKVLRRLLERLVNTKAYLVGGVHRRYDSNSKHENYVEAQKIVQELSQKMSPHEVHAFLTDTVNAHNKDPRQTAFIDQQKLVEAELEHAMKHQTMSLLDKARVVSNGQNDYLQINHDHADMFVTVIPNNIYYNIEKKCANWLDDCSLQGIRGKLLQKVRSPYK